MRRRITAMGRIVAQRQPLLWQTGSQCRSFSKGRLNFRKELVPHRPLESEGDIVESNHNADYETEMERFTNPDNRYISDEFREATDSLVNDLLVEVFKPHEDEETQKQGDRKHLRSLPHDPDEYFITRPRDEDAYLTLLRVHTAKALVDQGIQVYRRALEQGYLTPNRMTYTAMISLHGARAKQVDFSKSHGPQRFRKDVDAALLLYDEMLHKKIKPTIHTYGALISTCAALEHMDEAFRVFELMKFDGFKPNRIIYTSLIVACHRTGNLERAQETYMEMRIAGVELDILTYNTLIRIAADDDNAERALDIMSELRYFGLEPNMTTYVNAIHACSKRKDFHAKAFELYDTCMANGFVPTTRLLNVLLHVCKNMGDFETAAMLFEQFDTYNLKPDEVSYNSFISGIAMKMKSLNYTCSDGSVVDQAARISLAEEKFDEMLEAGIRPSRRACNAMLQVHCRALHWKQAEDFRRIVFRKYGHEYDYYTYFQMTLMYFHWRRLDDCLGIYHEMKAAGVPPDWDLYMLLLRLCKRRKATFVGVKILKEMCDNGLTATPHIAAPFQELVEAMPDYKPPPSLCPNRHAIHPKEIEGIESKDAKALKQAKKQKEMMLKQPTSPLEQHRSWVMNFYNDEKFHPGNPRFEQNYVNRERLKKDLLPEPEKWERTKYRLHATDTPAIEGEVSAAEAEAETEPAGSEVLRRRGAELKEAYEEAGHHLDKPRDHRVDPRWIKVK